MAAEMTDVWMWVGEFYTRLLGSQFSHFKLINLPREDEEKKVWAAVYIVPDHKIAGQDEKVIRMVPAIYQPILEEWWSGRMPPLHIPKFKNIYDE